MNHDYPHTKDFFEELNLETIPEEMFRAYAEHLQCNVEIEKKRFRREVASLREDNEKRCLHLLGDIVRLEHELKEKQKAINSLSTHIDELLAMPEHKGKMTTQSVGYRNKSVEVPYVDVKKDHKTLWDKLRNWTLK